jgi:hypothetical protein
MVTVIKDGESGIIHTDIDYLINGMKKLVDDKSLAVKLGHEGKKTAMARFNIQRFSRDWNELLTQVVRRETFYSRCTLLQTFMKIKIGSSASTHHPGCT